MEMPGLLVRPAIVVFERHNMCPPDGQINFEDHFLADRRGRSPSMNNQMLKLATPRISTLIPKGTKPMPRYLLLLSSILGEK